jgi:FkbM family methyltransferase
MNQHVQRPLSPALRLYRFINRPYYWYRPSQIAIRLSPTAWQGDGPALLRTAWGSHLYCWPDPLGRAVARTGVYDLTVAETLARLADPGETAVDAGANVGLMSNLLAYATGASGRVVSFEPHPLIFDTLTRNITRWQTSEGINVIEPRQAAVSATEGVLPLGVDPVTFAENKGTASLEEGDSADAIDVRTASLDREFPSGIDVLKLDVEMHELEALRGARALLSGRLVRDILFEEHQPPPTPVTALLESHGYTILGVRQGIVGPILSTPADAYRRKLWDPPALLATTDPERVRLRLKRRGWLCLSRRFTSSAR